MKIRFVLFFLICVFAFGCGSGKHPAEPEMVFVQGGAFVQGCTAEQGNDCMDIEHPPHNVTVSSFNIGKYEVTQAQWYAIMETTIEQQRDKTDAGFPIVGRGENYPMYYVSWDEVQEFITRLNSITGKRYRLPTEAEWEYAARGGAQSKGYTYSGSNNVDEVAWYDLNSEDSTQPVGTKKPNELGIYDMSGNVYEWCSDWYDDYTASDKTNPAGSAAGTHRVDRGAGFGAPADKCRVSFRGRGIQDRRYMFMGFRLVHP
jgi:formylglycine-generating enzyme required for sulfatase activity